MKNWLAFLLGFISGIVFIIFIAAALAGVSEEETRDNGMTLFEQPAECLSTNRFEVMQVISDNYALAHEQKYESYINQYINTDLLVLITNDNGEYYYDDQVIKVPKGKCARQIGVYKYQTKLENWKTVPIVKIME